MGTETPFNSEIFEGLTEAQRLRILALARERKVSKGQTLFRLGENSDTLFVIREGTVDLTFPLLVMGESKEVRFQTLGPGKVLAWSALVPPHRLTMSGRSNTDGVLSAFGRAEMLKLFREDAAIGFALMTNLAAVIGGRYLEFQALWVREVQRSVSETYR